MTKQYSDKAALRLRKFQPGARSIFEVVKIAQLFFRLDLSEIRSMQFKIDADGLIFTNDCTKKA
jgi:hypothetical protein